jgi:hypothetical protein
MPKLAVVFPPSDGYLVHPCVADSAMAGCSTGFCQGMMVTQHTFTSQSFSLVSPDLAVGALRGVRSTDLGVDDILTASFILGYDRE